VTPPASTPSAPVVAFDEWLHVVNTRLCPCVGRTERREEFRGVFNRSDLGAIGMVTASRSGGTTMWRTREMIRQLDPEAYNLSLQLDGAGVSTFGDGTVNVLRPGVVALADSSRPVRHTSDSGLDAVVGLTSRTG
jgi:AraC-binding-like domain